MTAQPASPSLPAIAPSAELPQGESQWAIIVREIRKRRTAMICYWAIVLLAVLSIFAPFLANDRPIAYSGFNRGEYDRARLAAIALLGQLASPPTNADGQPLEINQQDVADSVLNRLRDMRQQVSIESRANIQSVVDQFRATDEPTPALLGTLQEELQSLGPEKVKFVNGWRFPVCTTLNGLDIGFMLAAALFLTAPLWRRALRQCYGAGHPAINRWSAVLLGVCPVLAGVAWWLTVPVTNDLSQYKRGLLVTAPADRVRRSGVVYESVIWPLIPYGLDENDLAAKKVPPVWRADPKADRQAEDGKRMDNGLPARPVHWLGTDNLGRDLACRMLWGGRVSLAVGVVAVTIYVGIGVLIGALAGYFRGWVDMVISRIIEVVICFPSFFLILAIVAFVGPSMWVIMVVIGLTSWTGVARLVRAEFLRLSEQEFVLAGRVLGYSPSRLIFRHVLPNAMAPVMVSATFGVAGAILTESALSFLGLGITVPKPSWGGILSDGRDAIFNAEWIIIVPGLAIFLTITCYNLIGEAFRDAADPRLRGSR